MNRPVQPPRYVPTLTQVVIEEPRTQSVVVSVPAAQTTSPAVPLHPHSPLELEEALVHRVLQRIDLTLERELREAVGKVIVEHIETLMPRLRAEIEAAVRRSTEEALSPEISPTLPDRPLPR